MPNAPLRLNKDALYLPSSLLYSMKMWKLGCVAVVLFSGLLANAQTSTPAQALELEQQEKLAEAEKSWRQITQADPRDAAAFASLGLVLSKQGKYGQAVPAYRKAIALNPKLPGVHLNWGLAEFKQSHFDAAVAPLGAALAADPENQQARTLLGLSCYGAKRFEDVAKYLELPAKSDPTHMEPHGVLAQTSMLAKKYSCALAEFRQILEQAPDSGAAHMLTGEALDGLGRTVEAVVEFEAAVKMAPREPNANFGLRHLYWKLHKYDEAKGAFESELSIDPEHAQALAY